MAARRLHPFEVATPVIGMVHLRPLPGSMYYEGSLDAVTDAALADAWHLSNAGFDGLIIENYGDIPFRKNRVEPHTVALMTTVAAEIVREIDLPIGINVLRNDPFAAIAVAAAIGARFIRVNVLSGVMVTDQGIVEGEAAEVVAYLDRIAPELAIYADVNVKHARPLVDRPVEELAVETAERGGAHSLIVTGSQTGVPIDIDELRVVRDAVAVPVVIGSGASIENVGEIIGECDGIIVGSSIKVDGVSGNPVDPARAVAFVEAVRG